MSEQAYAVNLPAGDDDSVSFVIQAAYYTFGKITAIRVQDLGVLPIVKFFAWDNGTWDYTPMVTPGTGHLYISFGVQNQGNQAGNIVMNLIVGGATVKTVTAYADPGAIVGLEWTGDMPAANVTVQCTCAP